MLNVNEKIDPSGMFLRNLVKFKTWQKMTIDDSPTSVPQCDRPCPIAMPLL